MPIPPSCILLNGNIEFHIYHKLTCYSKDFFTATKINFSFFLNCLPNINSGIRWKYFDQKQIAIFLQLKSFVVKATFNSYSFNKVIDFVTTQDAIQYFSPFYI